MHVCVPESRLKLSHDLFWPANCFVYDWVHSPTTWPSIHLFWPHRSGLNNHQEKKPAKDESITTTSWWYYNGFTCCSPNTCCARHLSRMAICLTPLVLYGEQKQGTNDSSIACQVVTVPLSSKHSRLQWPATGRRIVRANPGKAGRPPQRPIRAVIRGQGIKNKEGSMKNKPKHLNIKENSWASTKHIKEQHLVWKWIQHWQQTS